ncbi:hemicentin-2 isoform X3 [Agrilus planipennis]|uniref:Hemicentin-2 isoform X3 n=1 Tax=Agrilus planipennis TaxID=224129 RepID=A0A7F5RME1_AGRPL|nr:hemicentin-2 isoform X3 [Agrilus planipennis]
MTGSAVAGVIIHLILLTTCFSLTGATKEVKALVGSSAFLPCKVDTSQCGELHSVKWYRGGSRIYVYSKAGFSRGEGDTMKRMTIENTKNESEASLRISPVEVDDEATYKCEITYLDVRENCDVVQVVKLRTLVIPAFVRLIGSNGRSLGNESILGPINEGTNIEITCEANGGRPVPKVIWYNGSKEIEASYSSHDDGEGVGTGRSKLSITLTRGDLGARFECRVESAALEEPIVSWITADVNVRPTKLELGGVNSHVVQGSNVLLTCDVYGAKPAAEVKWYNNSDLIVNPDKVLTIPEMMRDGTFTTKSSLRFVASRWENGQAFHCYAENLVTKELEEPPLHEVLPLEVLYPPIVTVSPANITTNESVDVLLLCSYIAHPSNLIDVVWSKDGKNLTLNDADKYVGGNTKDPSLIIKSVTRDDMGRYRCICKNMVGSSESEESIFLNIHFPPVVGVAAEPSTPVKAIDRTNVTLTCNVIAGNPPTLLNVEWYLDGELLEKLPRCSRTENKATETFCSPDPSVLLLREVDEKFAGFYECRGSNIAGWGSKSDRKELVVYYPPGPAFVQYFPSRVIKKGSVTLECSVIRPGRPEEMTFEWYRGNHLVPDVTTSNWTIYPVTLETKTNFTCLAVNEGGKSTNSSIGINVLAPPSFIQALPPYQGVLATSNNISLTCRVECSPLCSITWYQDGYKLNSTNNPLYYTKTVTHLPDTRKNDFESIESTLVWNMTSWPNQQLDKVAPNSNYTCQSSTNGVGPGVNSTIEIAVDYPPENLTVTNRVISVVEHYQPERVICSGKGHPALSFVWKNSENQVISKSHVLSLGLVDRQDSGTYVCEASNRHGTTSTTIILNVQYPPECSIQSADYEQNPAIMCSAHADPQEIGFIWKIQGVNDSIINPSLIYQEGLKSYLLIDPSLDTVRTYQCFANNSVGISEPCEYEVTGVKPWWKRFDNENMIILIAVIIGIIICVIIICIIIICICRRKRSQSKYNSHVELEEREKFLCTHTPDVLGLPLITCGRLTSLGFSAPNTTIGTADRKRNGGSSRNGSKDPLTLAEKEFYENLPFHGMQNPPNKPVSVIMPIVKEVHNKNVQNAYNANLNYPPALIYRHANNYNIKSKKVQRVSGNILHRSFENREESKQNLLNSSQTTLASFSFTPISSRFQDSIRDQKVMRSQSFTQQINFSINAIQEGKSSFYSPNSQLLNTSSQLFHTREMFSKDAPSPLRDTFKEKEERRPTSPPPSFRRLGSSKNSSFKTNYSFGSLDLRKHRCYSPTFYSLRCKKHGKKRSVMYTLPKSYFSNSTLKLTKHASTKSTGFQKQNSNNDDIPNENAKEKGPVPAPRCKKHQRRLSHIYQNVNNNISKDDNSKRNDKSESPEVSKTFQETAIVHKEGESEDTCSNNKSEDATQPSVVQNNLLIRAQNTSVDNLPKKAPSVPASTKLNETSQVSSFITTLITNRFLQKVDDLEIF